MENNITKSDDLGVKVLKIYTKYFKRFGYYILLPEIRLSGKWLQNLGFNFGSNIIVRTEKGKIIIRNEEKITIVL